MYSEINVFKIFSEIRNLTKNPVVQQGQESKEERRPRVSRRDEVDNDHFLLNGGSEH